MVNVFRTHHLKKSQSMNTLNSQLGLSTTQSINVVCSLVIMQLYVYNWMKSVPGYGVR